MNFIQPQQHSVSATNQLPQACGVAFGILVWDNVNVFIAFLVLSAEGYFSLVRTPLIVRSRYLSRTKS